MTLIIITFCILIAITAAIFRKRSIVLLGIGLALILLFSIGTGLLPRLAVQNLQTYAPLLQPEWKTQNAIVVVGLGTLKWPAVDHISLPILGYSRINEAARLYFSCKKQAACTVITSGGDPSGNGKSEAEIMARDLISLGVPEADIKIEDKSNNTFQNAQFTSEILRANPADQVILVTTGLHMKRTLLYFAHFLIRAVPAPADYWRTLHTLFPAAYNFSIMDFAIHEYVGLIRYQIYNLMGWNAKPVTVAPKE